MPGWSCSASLLKAYKAESWYFVSPILSLVMTLPPSYEDKTILSKCGFISEMTVIAL